MKQPIPSINDETNPKDLIGVTKVSMTALPAIGPLMGNLAMMDGSDKYGPYNWREKKIQARIYIDAMKRHLDLWLEGEEFALDSQVHHLGHVIAGASILLDALETKQLIDDRPRNGSYFRDVMRAANDLVKSKKESPK